MLSRLIIICPNAICQARYCLNDDCLHQRVKCEACGIYFEVLEPAATAAAGNFAAVSLRSGDVLANRFLIKETLAASAHAVVHRAHHQSWDIDVVLKQINCRNLLPSQLKAYHKLAARWQQLGTFPQLLTCFYELQHAEQSFLVLEYVAGKTLATCISDGDLYSGDEPTVLERILDMALQLAWALKYVHSYKQVHLELRPDTVLVTAEGSIKLSGFGLSEMFLRTAYAELVTTPHNYMPSKMLQTQALRFPLYFAPEQARSNSIITPAVDVYRWALVVVEMLRNYDVWEDAAQTVLTPETAPSSILPAALLNLLRQCLQWEALQRPQDMNQVITVLRRVYQSLCTQPYSHSLSSRQQHLADSHNNWGAAAWDLGQDDVAGKCFATAQAHNSRHAESTFNLYRWRWLHGEISDQEMTSALSELHRSQPDNWMAAYLLGMAQIECGDAVSAVRVLQNAGRRGKYLQLDKAQHLAEANADNAAGRVRDFLGHNNQIEAVDLAADCRLLLSASTDGSLRLWDAPRGLCLQVLQHNGQTMRCCRFFADQKRALAGGSDGSLQLWDLTSGTLVWEVCAHDSHVLDLQIRRDGKRAISAGADSVLRLWDLSGKTPLCLSVLEGHEQSVNAVAVSTDFTCAASGSSDGSVRIWDLNNARQLHVLEGHSKPVLSVAISQGLLLSGSRDKTMRLWQLQSGDCQRVLNGHGQGISCVALTADGRWAVSGGWDKTVRVWETSSGRCMRTFTAHSSWVSALNLSADGAWAVSGGADNKVTLWYTGPLCSRTAAAATQPLQVAISLPRPDSAITFGDTQLYEDLLRRANKAIDHNRIREALLMARQARSFPGAGDDARLVKIWQKLNSTCVRISLNEAQPAWIGRDHDSAVSAVALRPDAMLGLSGSHDKQLRLWNMQSGQCLRTFSGHSDLINSVCFSADGKLAASASCDATVRLWDLGTGSCIYVFAGHQSFATAVRFIGRSQRLASAGWDKSVCIWDRSSNTALLRFVGHSDKITCLDCSSDGQYLVSGSYDSSVRLWEVQTGKSLAVLLGHQSYVSAVAFRGQDSSQVLSAGYDQVLRLWDVKKSKCIAQMPGHTAFITALAVSANGRWAFTGGCDRTIRLWDLTALCCVRIFTDHSGFVQSVAHSLDGCWLLSGSADMTVRAWNLAWNLKVATEA